MHGVHLFGSPDFFHRRFLEYVDRDESCILERTPLVRLAKDGQLCVYKHDGYWACMDTQRDREQLTKLWESGAAPWKVWESAPTAAKNGE